MAAELLYGNKALQIDSFYVLSPVEVEVLMMWKYISSTILP